MVQLRPIWSVAAGRCGRVACRRALRRMRRPGVSGFRIRLSSTAPGRGRGVPGRWLGGTLIINYTTRESEEI
jgi:hypothetical protein